MAKAKNIQVASAFRNCLHPYYYIPLLRTRSRYMAPVHHIPSLDWIYMVYLASYSFVAINPGYLDVLYCVSASKCHRSQLMKCLLHRHQLHVFAIQKQCGPVKI
jgi:hypothetical protein